MFWNRYDGGNGTEPVCGDKIESCHFGKHNAEFTGVFAGRSANDSQIGIMILDKKYRDALAVTLPIVCMRLRK